MGCCKLADSGIKGCYDLVETYSKVNIYKPEYVDVKIKGLLTQKQLDKSRLIKLWQI